MTENKNGTETPMERVTAKQFFSVLWRGVCQAVRWFLGLFGFGKKGRFAKIVWGVFATCVTLAVLVWTVISVVLLYDIFRRKSYRHRPSEYFFVSDKPVGYGCYFRDSQDGRSGYIYNEILEEVWLEDVAWVANPLDEGAPVCFSNGEKRGYFSSKMREVVIEPRYDHAWIFSEGVASVEVDGKILFIDETGQVVLDPGLPYIEGMEGYVFHGGYCVVDTDDGAQCGLMDRTGAIVLPREYSRIWPSNDFQYWWVRRGTAVGLLNRALEPIIPLTEGAEIVLPYGESTIVVTTADHTQRLYDLTGKLLDAMCIDKVRLLEYESDEVLYREDRRIVSEDSGEKTEYILWESYHPLRTARLRAYVVGYWNVGLMTADGQIVTKPIYRSIEAIGPDLYQCEVADGYSVVLNGRGEQLW